MKKMQSKTKCRLGCGIALASFLALVALNRYESRQYEKAGIPAQQERMRALSRQNIEAQHIINTLTPFDDKAPISPNDQYAINGALGEIARRDDLLTDMRQTYQRDKEKL